MGLERTLRRWLDGQGLLSIIGTVLAVITTLAVVLVVGGYWLATR